MHLPGVHEGEAHAEGEALLRLHQEEEAVLMEDLCSRCKKEPRQGSTKWGAECWRKYREGRKKKKRPGHKKLAPPLRYAEPRRGGQTGSDAQSLRASAAPEPTGDHVEAEPLGMFVAGTQTAGVHDAGGLDALLESFQRCCKLSHSINPTLLTNGLCPLHLQLLQNVRDFGELGGHGVSANRIEGAADTPKIPLTRELEHLRLEVDRLKRELADARRDPARPKIQLAQPVKLDVHLAEPVKLDVVGLPSSERRGKISFEQRRPKVPKSNEHGPNCTCIGCRSQRGSH